jgi:hypothetical protein
MNQAICFSSSFFLKPTRKVAFWGLHKMSYELFKAYWFIMLSDETSGAASQVFGTPLCSAAPPGNLGTA